MENIYSYFLSDYYNNIIIHLLIHLFIVNNCTPRTPFKSLIQLNLAVNVRERTPNA